MEKKEFSFFESLRVRYSEIDGQGIVFNAHYLTYFDVALNEYLRHIAFDYHEMVATLQLDFRLVKSEVEYLGPIRFDDVLSIGVRPGRVGTTSLTWELGIFKPEEEKCYATGRIIWVCMDVTEQKPHPLPPQLLTQLSSAQ